MKPLVEGALWTFAVLLFCRASYIYYALNTTASTDTGLNSSCYCKCTKHKNKSNALVVTKQSQAIFFLPVKKSNLSTDHTRVSLTRLASEINFNAASCPEDSVVTTPQWASQQPVHTSCPALFVIGARKAGTTSLYQYLSHHPDFEGIHLEKGPQAGETYYFSARYYKESWKHYRSRFPKNEYILTGDASVGNLVNCLVPKRIFESCGNQTKIVMLFRNPINRYVSNFLMRVHRGTRNLGNNTALTTVIKMEMEQYYSQLISGGSDLQFPAKQWSKLTCKFKPSENMIFEGLYYVHLQNWLCNYPFWENVLILNSEEFYSDTSAILAQVYQFIGLSTLTQHHRDVITSFVFNKGTHAVLPHHKLLVQDKKKLRSIYSPFNKALLQLLNWPKVKWD